MLGIFDGRRWLPGGGFVPSEKNAEDPQRKSIFDL